MAVNITPATWDTLSNATGLCGILCLAVPAMYANKYGRLIALLATSKTAYESPKVQESRDKALKALSDLQNTWTAWKSNLLIAGTLLAGISYVLGLLKVILA